MIEEGRCGDGGEKEDEPAQPEGMIMELVESQPDEKEMSEINAVRAIYLKTRWNTGVELSRNCGSRRPRARQLHQERARVSWREWNKVMKARATGQSAVGRLRRASDEAL